jgi:hypothetical protein
MSKSMSNGSVEYHLTDSNEEGKIGSRIFSMAQVWKHFERALTAALLLTGASRPPAIDTKEPNHRATKFVQMKERTFLTVTTKQNKCCKLQVSKKERFTQTDQKKHFFIRNRFAKNHKLFKCS